MRSLRLGLIDIIRDFVSISESATNLVRRHREGSLRFSDVEAWVGGDSGSELFRLKEHCHSIFRPLPGDDALDMRVGALLDLAVGSLFHEAMKLRENLYQQEHYGPRVKALRTFGDPESVDLFEEFEKILAKSAVRLDECVAEVEAMLAQARKQLLRLILERGRTGVVARCLYEASERTVAICPEGLDALYEQIFGDAVTGYVMAAESYLESAYYGYALAALAEARRREPEYEEVRRAIDYAEGMQAFFSRDYRVSVERLSDWLGSNPAARDPDRLSLALAGTRHIEHLPEGEEAKEVITRAAEISERIRALQQR